ncbi:MAG TPA: hypothetical protein VJ385_17775 [Fibrobacteria bacterium]|nr:hypothetical protein [Fibrobacteria bacterium]
MPKPLPSPFSVSHPFAAGFPAAVLALSIWAGLSGCKPVDIDEPAKDSTSVTADSAILRVSNKINQDPDSITILLFSGNAVDIVNANVVKRLGGVPYGATNRRMTVPAGTWKLAYEDNSGVLIPMSDVNSAAQDWLKSIFVKDGDYSLILSSDGNRTVWNPTFRTDPAIE